MVPATSPTSPYLVAVCVNGGITRRWRATNNLPKWSNKYSKYTYICNVGSLFVVGLAWRAIAGRVYWWSMVITYHGGQFFKLVRGDTVIAFDPIAKDNPAKWPTVKFGANVVFNSLHHPNFNGLEQLSSANRQPFVIQSPGEYEVGDITARGFGVSTVYNDVTRFNTIYQLQFDGMNIVFLGALGDPDVGATILGALSDIDILFLPIGGGDVLEAPQASKLAVKLEARAIIPMHYDKAALQAFLKEEGVEKQKPVEKFTVKKKDLTEMSGEVVVLAS